MKNSIFYNDDLFFINFHQALYWRRFYFYFYFIEHLVSIFRLKRIFRFFFNFFWIFKIFFFFYNSRKLFSFFYFNNLAIEDDLVLQYNDCSLFYSVNFFFFVL